MKLCMTSNKWYEDGHKSGPDCYITMIAPNLPAVMTSVVVTWTFTGAGWLGGGFLTAQRALICCVSLFVPLKCAEAPRAERRNSFIGQASTPPPLIPICKRH